MQATVRSFDPASGSGSVFLDDGTVAGFGPAALAGSGLRLLRPGQRVAIGCDPGGAITGLTLATFPLVGPAGPAGPSAPPGTAAGDAAKGAG
jgi:cold shock CspA family protein